MWVRTENNGAAGAEAGRRAGPGRAGRQLRLRQRGAQRCGRPGQTGRTAERAPDRLQFPSSFRGPSNQARSCPPHPNHGGSAVPGPTVDGCLRPGRVPKPTSAAAPVHAHLR